MPNEFKVKNGLIVDLGGANITGSVIATGGFTGSLLGTASNAVSSSFATTASFVTSTVLSSSYAATASYVLNAISSSFATSASLAAQAGNASTIDINVFGSPVDSYLLMSNVAGTTGVAIGGDADLRYNSSTNVLTVPNISATTLTGSLFGTASNALTASFINSASTNAFVQGGNSFGAQALLGTNDNQSLAFETSGSTRMFISSSGNVGIATVTPGYGLEVGNTGIYYNPGQLLITTSGSVNKEGSFIASSTGRTLQLGIFDNSVVPVGIDMFETNNTFGSTYLNFRVNNADLVRMTGSFVGIGTTTPLFTLDVSGSGRFTNNLTVTGSTTLHNGQTTIQGAGATSATNALVVRNSNVSSALTITDARSSSFGGNVDIAGDLSATNSSGTRKFQAGYFYDIHPEALNPGIIPFYSNDLAYNTLRGGSVSASFGPGSTYTLNTSQIEAMFDGSSNYCIMDPMATSGSVTLTVTFPQSYLYGNIIGFSFGNSSWVARDFTVELLVTGSYVTLDTQTGYTAANYTKYFGYGVNATTGARITFSNFVSPTNAAGFRIAELFLLNYNSQLGKAVFMGRDGGAVYKPITIQSGSTSAPAYSSLTDTNTGIYFPAADTLGFVEGGAEAMRINSSGQVGIGTTSPAFTLDVSGSGRFTNGLTVTGSLTATSFTGSLLGTSSWAVSASQAVTASYVLNAISSSFSSTASYVLNAVSASFASTASSVNTLRQNVILSGSLLVSGSILGSGSSYNTNIDLISSAVSTNGTGSITFGTKYLVDNNNARSVRWNERYLTDSNQSISVDWNSRTLVSGSTNVLDWSSGTGSLIGTSSWATRAISASFLPVGTYNITSSWAVSASQAVSASRAVTSSFAISASWAPGGAAFPYIGTAIITGSLIVSGANGGINTSLGFPVLFQNDGVNTVVFGNGKLWLNDSVGGTSVDWGNRYLLDTSGTTKADWEQNYLADGAAITRVDWGNGALNDSVGTMALDWESRRMIDTAGARSADFDTRFLIYPNGTTAAINYGTQGQIAMTGSVSVTGSLTVSGSSTFTNIGPAVFSGSVSSLNGFTGSLQGTASYATQALSASWAPGGATTAGAQIFGNYGGSGFANPIVTYLPFGFTTVSGNESQRQLHVGVGGTVKNFYLRTNSTAVAGSYTTFTIRINGASSGIQIAVSGGQVANVYSDTTNTATINPGDYVSIQVSTSIANGPQLNSYGFAIE